MRWTASALLMNCNPASARTRIERRLEGEVKSGERFHRRQLSHWTAILTWRFSRIASSSVSKGFDGSDFATFGTAQSDRRAASSGQRDRF